MPFHGYYVKRMKSVDPQINSSLFSYIFKRANIFSYIDFSHKCLHHSVSCGMFYPIKVTIIKFHFYQKSLNTSSEEYVRETVRTCVNATHVGFMLGMHIISVVKQGEQVI